MLVSVVVHQLLHNTIGTARLICVLFTSYCRDDLPMRHVGVLSSVAILHVKSSTANRPSLSAGTSKSKALHAFVVSTFFKRIR